MSRRRTATAPARCVQSNLSGKPLCTCPDHAWARGLMTKMNSDLTRRAIVERGIFWRDQLANASRQRRIRASSPITFAEIMIVQRVIGDSGDLVGDPY